MIVEIILAFLLVVPFIWVKKVSETDSAFFGLSRPVGSWSIALSAVATNHSAFVYLGQIGFTYTYGLEGLWLTVGWKLGDWLSMLSLQAKIKSILQNRKLFSLGGLLEILLLKPSPILHCFYGCLIVFALLVYASAQLTALYKVIGFYGVQEKWVFLLVVLLVVFYYLSRGGFKASIKTDKLQSLIIFLSITVLFFLGLAELHTVGGSVFDSAVLSDKQLIKDPFNLGPLGALLLFLLGWFVAGMGTIAQPHMLTRFMIADTDDELKGAQYKYIIISSLFSLPIIGVALLARELLPVQDVADPELALFLLSSVYFPSVIVLVLIYGVISAAMSTLDSLVVAAAAIVVRDIAPAIKPASLSVRISPRVATAAVIVAVFIYWLFSIADVFGTVFSAWSLIVAINFPIIVLLLLRKEFDAREIFLGVLGSALVLGLWNRMIVDVGMHELIPALLSFFIMVAITRAFADFRNKRHQSVVQNENTYEKNDIKKPG